MNTKRILFWGIFIIILALIVWGLIAAMNKAPQLGKLLEPAPVTSADHIRGPASAPVTLIEYGDFQCPACGVYFPIFERVWNEASTSVRLVFRHFPLSQHPNAIPAAKASEAASLQGKFWEMFAQLYENQSEWSDAPDASPIFAKYAATIGLDAAKFKSDSALASLASVIQADEDEGIHIGINHTPTFFLNGKEISPNTYADFKALIDAAIAGSAK